MQQASVLAPNKVVQGPVGVIHHIASCGRVSEGSKPGRTRFPSKRKRWMHNASVPASNVVVQVAVMWTHDCMSCAKVDGPAIHVLYRKCDGGCDGHQFLHVVQVFVMLWSGLLTTHLCFRTRLAFFRHPAPPSPSKHLVGVFPYHLPRS